VYAELDRRGLGLVQRLLDGLGATPGVQVFGPLAASARTPTVAFTLGNRHPDAVADALAEEAVFVSTGDFYAASVVRRYGLEARGGLVRAGCAAYTTEDEVDRLLAGVARLARAR
jgi:selenocysteine lyase/cysteine desulfurase